MRWEKWKTSGPEQKLLWIVCSIIWTGFFLLAAVALNLTVPYLPLAIAGGFLFYLRNWPGKIEQWAWFAVSLAFGLIVRFPHDHNWINAGSGVLALFGLGAFFMMGLRWMWSGQSERRKTLAVLAPAASLVFFVLSAQRALSLANLLYPKTYDLYLYLFDGSFGLQPSFLMGRAMASSMILRVAASLTYISLPFVMALVYALHQPKNADKPSWDMITLFLLAGLGGWALYNIVPATGPAYVFAADFPWHSLPYASLHRLFLEQVPVNGDVPRNAIPSLHMAWVLLLVWNSKGMSRLVRAFLGTYLALTAVSTLGTGEHYFVDLVAGVPFALMVQAIVSPGKKTVISRRVTAAASGLGITIAWLLLVRFAAKSMLVLPLLPWSLVGITCVGVWWMQSWFAGTSQNASLPTNSEAPQAKTFSASAN